MSYQSILHKLFNSVTSHGIKLGLENPLWINAQLHNPEKTFTTIHVAGTNGKGSVCTKIASALENAGYKTGLYTSPHIATFRERIKINGVMISENDVVEIMNNIFQICSDHNRTLTFFELTTALAFAYFAAQKIDIAVIETGLGGRLDATNTIQPILSIITSISYDHTELLGNTLEEITFEKAGIIKPNIPIVIGPKVSKEIIQKTADALKASLIKVEGSYPTYEQENTAIAKSALDVLKNSINLPLSAIEAGLKTNPINRMQIINQEITIILDVAHNPDGIKELLKSVSSLYPNREIECVCGFSKGKDVLACLKELKSQVKHLHLVCSTNERGMPVESLLLIAKDAGFSTAELSTYSEISKGLSQGINEAKSKNRILLVCGSFFIMADIRKTLFVNEPSDLLDLN